MARLGRTQVEYKLRAPTVVGPSIVFAPVRVGLTDASRPARFVLQYGPHSKLRAPTTTSATATPLARPLRIALARAPQPARTSSRLLRLPLFAATPVAQPLRISLAKARRPERTTSRLFRLPALAPVVLTLDQTKLRAKFAPRYPQPVTHSIIRRPVVVRGPLLPEQLRLRTMFARSPKQGLRARSFLRGPTVIGSAVVGAASTLRFGPPSPEESGFAGSPDRGGFAPPSPERS